MQSGSVGYKIGKSVFNSHILMFKSRSPYLFELTTSLFKHDGFGIIETQSLDLEGYKTVVKVYDSFECSMFNGSKESKSYPIRGWLGIRVLR